MINLATSISLYSSTSINEALGLPVSIVTRVFESRSFDSWKQVKESEVKTQVAITSRLNEVIRGLGVVAKTIAGRRF